MEIAGRSLARWNCAVHEFAGVAEFCAAPTESGAIHSVTYGRSVIDLLPNLRPGRPLVVCLNGALTNRDSVHPPVFAGTGVLAGCDVSALFINDPGIYLTESLGLAWYAGWEGVHLQDDLVAIIQKVARDAGATGIAFLGGSGGGFASLVLSAALPGSLAVVWNPQTDLFRYNRTFVEAYTAPAWGATEPDDVRSRMQGQARHEAVSLYAQRPENFVLYLQNATDWHVKLHLMPIIGGREPVSGFATDRMYVEMGDFGEGHAAPGKDYLGTLLPRVFARADWAALFASRSMPIPA